MYSSSESLFRPLVLEEAPKDADGAPRANRFYRTRQRSDRNHSMRFRPNPQCFANGFVFTVSHRLRVSNLADGDGPLGYYLRFRGRRDGTDKWEYPKILQCEGISAEDGWKACSGPLLIDEVIESLVEISVEVIMDNVAGAEEAVVDWDDVSIAFKSGPAEGIAVDSARSSRWAANAEIAITSSTLDWQDSQTAVIASVHAGDGATTTLKLSSSIAAVLSEKETPGMGVEVALLTRNLKIEGEYIEGESTRFDGGYLQIFHTPGVAQTIEGVEFTHMGQKSAKNRYPIQFLYTKDAAGSSISRNSIRSSNLRCISLDGVSNVTVSSNVAHDTAGHCYYVGYEATDNSLFGNLGLSTNGDIGWQENSPDMNDHDRATFYVRNSQNDFVGNVAAGGAGRGWTFDGDWRTYGEDHKANGNLISPGGNPRRLPMGTFRDNTAHTNYYQGFKLYSFEQWYTFRDLDRVPVFENLKAYRNREHGIYTYNTIAAEYRGGLLSDNQWGIVIRRADGVLVQDYDIVGSSEVFKDHTAARSRKLCSHPSWTHQGIHMQSMLSNTGHLETGRGLRLRNVHLSGYDKEKEWYPMCKSTEAIAILSDTKDGHWDYTSSADNVSVVDHRQPSKIMDGCRVALTGVTDIVITDVDGSLDPAGNAAVGALVSDSTHVTDILGDACTSIGNCMAYCSDVCLRTFSLMVSQFGTENWKLRVTNTKSGHTMLIPGTIQTIDEHYFSDPYASRRFSASLPAGAFTAEFLDEFGIFAWPTYVEEYWSKEPDCIGSISFEHITILKPPTTPTDCTELIRNRGHDAEFNTSEPWFHTLYRRNKDWDIKVGSGLGVNGTSALVTKGRDRYTGLGQDIDSRCLETMKGEYYDFSAWMRVTKAGDQPQPGATNINPNEDWWSHKSPLMNMHTRVYRSSTTKEHMTTKADYDRAYMSRTYDPDGWNLLHGILRLPDTYRSFFEMESAPSQTEFIVDSASFTKMTCDPNTLLLNGNLEEGNSKYWDPWGGATGLDIVVGHGGTGHALRSFQRAHFSHGQGQVMNTDCVHNEGDRLSFEANIKFEQNGVTVPCNPFTWSNNERCSDMLMYTHKGNKREYHRVASITISSYDSDDGWYHIHGLWSLRPNQVQADYTKLYFDGMDKSYDVIVDNVQVKHIPKQCNALVENPSFTDGSLYWLGTYRDRLKVDLYSPGASGGESDFALRAYARDNKWYGIMQKLDPLCFVTGEEYDITSKFRLLDATSGEGVWCDVNHQWNSQDNCPSVSIYGQSCTGANVYWRFYNALGGDGLAWDPDSYNDFFAAFTVNEQLASCNDVYLYVHEVPAEFELVVDDLHILSHQTNAPTDAPTVGGTEPVTRDETEVPTSSPTTRPTVSFVTSCPQTDSAPAEISSGGVMLARSDSLCVLTKAVSDGANGTLSSIAPVAVSYDGGDWHIAAGTYATTLLGGQEFGDYTDGGHITLPNLNGDEKYYLTRYSNYVTDTDKVARLLESATFGTTAQDLASWDRGPLTTETAKEWIEEQMNMPVTSHREFFRRRSNGRLTHPVRAARSNHPCDGLSKWRKFAFSAKEGDRAVNSVPLFEAEYDEQTDTYITVKLNGHVRTVVRSIAFEDGSDHPFEFNKEYEMCNTPQEYEDGSFWLRIKDDPACITNNRCPCQALSNPLVHFYADSVQPLHVLNLPHVSEGVLEHIDELQTHGGEYILFDGLSGNHCNKLNDVTEENDTPVFGQLPDGSWLQFDPSILLEENTLEFPIPDGGGLVRSLTGDVTLCANAPRTFLNEGQCTLSDSATACDSAGTSNLLIDLDSNNISELHNITGQHLHGVIGLPLTDDFGAWQPWPCEPGLRSRWEIVDAASCIQTIMGDETNASLVELLMEQGTSDTNPLLRDIDFPIDKSCDTLDNNTLVEIEVVIKSQCFRRVHPDHMSVFDFTHLSNKEWVDTNSSGFLNYSAFGGPDTPETNPIIRWNNHYPMLSKLGRFGDTVQFVDLPNEIRLDEVSQHFSTATGPGGGGVMVCGSPFESKNDPRLGKVFDVVTGRDTSWDFQRQREYTWIQVGLVAQDQLRQRVAWSLAQLFVIARGAIGVEGSHSEVFLGFYDIFTRHAFGNYRDILREIAYSPLMGENLSYLQSKSAAYMWETQQKISFADENFSREIMQLFSTGLLKLNLDGTPQLDDQGNTILAYTNDEIMSFARIWTGFDYQQKRGNVEDSSWSGNRHDPMKIQSGWRDKFPKTDMTGGYIGDGFPLCIDLPDKMFLRKGAKYRLLGASHMPELMEDHSSFEHDPTLKKFVLDANSDLKTELCNADVNGNCQYESTVTLDHTVVCKLTECEADTVRVVQFSERVHYEYVRPPCVEHAFYANAKKVINQKRSADSSCANPLLPYASEACCEGQHDVNAERSPRYLYDQERVTFFTAGSRCQAMGMESCDFNDIEGLDSRHKKGYHWTTDSCAIQVKVNAIGQVALVYKPESYEYLHPHIRNDNRNYFKVYWDGDYPKNDNDVSVGNSCGNNTCESLVTGGCLCDTTITESRVFKEMPSSVDEVLSKLTTGMYDAAAYDEGTYAEAVTANGVTAYLSNSTLAFDTKTVFEVIDEYGRLLRFKNTKERVQIQGMSGYAFRNAPSFMSVLNSEADARDAYYETEAALDHYSYHSNTAPFVAFRFIQRFTTSNPKPRYVKAVATAFRTGSYEGIGSGQYGDISATIAAVLLDPEARSVNLDADPFKGNLREPLLRMMALMRGMELHQAEGHPVVKMDNLDIQIGQMAHSFPTVFSFLLPEYTPGGRPGDATLVGPETMIMDMPKVVGLLNGMFSLVKYGLSRCHGGFGTQWTRCDEGEFSSASASLSFSKPYTGTITMEDHAESVVSELSTILTSGRLGEESKRIIKEAYVAKLNDTTANDPAGGSALRLALQYVLTTPEFHTTNIVDKTGSLREQPEPLQSSGTPYKAIVYVMLGGGCDSFNMLVPHTCTTSGKDIYRDEYLEIRQEIGLDKDSLNVLNGPISNQVCETFGVHPQLEAVQQLFNDGDLLFFANTGVLTKETDKENYWKDTETRLFAHNFMQQAVQRVDPLKAEDSTGVLGRMRDILTEKGLNVGAFSISGNSVSLIGGPGVTATPMILNHDGIVQFNRDPSTANMDDAIAFLNAETKAESGVFAELYSDVLLKSLSHNQLLYDTLVDKTTAVTFPTSHLGRQLEMVAKMIDSRNERGADADMFFLSTGGWDTHRSVLTNQQRLFASVDISFKAFADEMSAKKIWDSVTLIQTSDFGRTLTQNGGLGSDHAWGGNYIMMGGSVKGGQIVGTYPHALKDGSPLNIGRGRIIPTTSWEAVFLPLAEWAGVEEADFAYICPNRDNFPESHFFNTADLFNITSPV